MAVNIGPKIGIDGEKEYRKQINDLITQQKTFSAEMKELESSFNDSTSAMDKNRKKAKLLGDAIKNQEKQVSELEKGLEASRKKYGENSTETQKWKQAVANAKTELHKMQTELKKIPSSLSSVGKGMQDVGKKMQSIGGNLTKYVTAPLAGIGAASIAAFNDVDAGLDIVVKKTGATGEALTSLEGSVKNLATTIPVSFETAGEAIGEVNTRFGLTGEELETLSGKFVKFAELNDTDVSSSIDKVQKIMEAFGMETEDADDLLDALNKTGQNTGISMDTLESSMIKNAASLQSMGMSAYDAAAFLGSVETSGADTSAVMKGLSTALTEAAKDGKTLPEALTEFQGIMASSASEQEKLTAATELFGKNAGKAIYNACKEGSLSFESLSTDAAEYMGSVEQTFDAVQDAPDKFTVAMNNVKVAGSEIGETLLTIAEPAISALGDAAGKASDWLETLDDDQKELVAYAAVFAAGLAPAVTVLGSITDAAGKAVSAVSGIVGKAAEIGGLSTPAGLAILGLAGMAAAMWAAREKGLATNETLQEMLAETTAATEELNEATGGLQGTLKTAQDNIDDINAKASSADKLVNELYKLEQQSNKTAVEQERMKLIIDELNEMYPGLGLEIDKTTGKLNKSKKAVKDYTDAAKKMALAEAYQKAAADTLQALVKETVAYEKAVKAQENGTKSITKLTKDYYDAVANAPEAFYGAQAVLDEQSGKLKQVTGDVIDASNALKDAETKQVGLNDAVDKANEAMTTAQEEYDAYKEAAETLSKELEGTTSAEEEQAKATDEVASSAENTSDALIEMAKAGVEAGKDIGKAAADEIKAYNDLYQAAYDSIQGQIGLFDEWSENTEITAVDMLKNLKSQAEGLRRYSSNMEKLAKIAQDSNDETVKAFVQNLAEMGVSAAGEVQVLVDTWDASETLFNNIIKGYGDVGDAREDAANADAAILNNFTKKSEIIAKNYSKTVKKESKDLTKQISTDASNQSRYVQYAWEKGYGKLPQIAARHTDKAVKDTTGSINGMKLIPSVSEVAVPPLTTETAKQRIKDGISNIPGSVGKLTGALAAGKTAAEEASSKMNVTGKVTSITGAKSAAQSAASSASAGLTVSAKMEISNVTSAALNAKEEFKRTVGTIYVPMAAKNQNSEVPMATGGYINEESVILAGEGGKSEVIIPLEANRSRALQLYEETGQILGVNTAASIQRSATATLPTESRAAAQSQKMFSLNAEKLYAAVAAGAEKGMESANIKIYWNNREAGRVLRDMGVKFA